MEKCVTVLIVSYNTRSLTLQCIESVYSEGSGSILEIVVVDNGSNDGSIDAIRKMKNGIDDIKIIENKTNIGFAKANNQGIKIAKGKYILLLNSDTKVKKGSIGKLVKFAKNTKKVGVVVPRLLNSDGLIQASVFRFPGIKLALEQYFLGKKGLLDKYAPKGDVAFQVEAAVMAAYLITPDALKKVGFLDEKYFMYFEDIDYSKRVNNLGLKIYYLSSSQVVHFHGASGKGMESRQKEFLIASSKLYHGVVKYYLYTFILWLGQKWQKLFHKSKVTNC